MKVIKTTYGIVTIYDINDYKKYNLFKRILIRARKLFR